MPGTHGKTEYLQLDYNREGKVVVTPENQDRFVLTIRQAAEGCEIVQRESEFRSRFKLLMDRLARWLRDHRDAVHRGYVTFGGGGKLLFVVIRSRKKFDRELTDALSDLDAQIAQSDELGLMEFNSIALPRVSEEEVESFLLPGGVWEYRRAE